MFSRINGKLSSSRPFQWAERRATGILKKYQNRLRTTPVRRLIELTRGVLQLPYLRAILKNVQNTNYTRFSFIPETGIAFPKMGVLYCVWFA